LRIDEIELVLDRHDGRETERAQGSNLFREQVTRVAEEGSAIGLEHRKLHLRNVALPRHRHERARYRHARPIRVPVREAEPRRLDGAAFDVEREHGSRQRHAAREHARDARAIDALAALDRIEVVHERVEKAHLRMSGEEAIQFGSGGGRHDVSRCLLFSTLEGAGAGQHKLPARAAPNGRKAGIGRRIAYLPRFVGPSPAARAVV
jgi:hypothetical protein